MGKPIIKAVKVKFTAGRIADFQCPKDKPQAFLWCDDPLGLAVRATVNGAKSYVYQSKVSGKSMRVTIGDISAWSIANAQTEARRLQVLIDQGHDPRQVKSDTEAARVAVAAAKQVQVTRESVTVGSAWNVYIEARKPFWGSRHYDDHVEIIQAGGEKRKRSKKKTEPGVLASLATLRLVDLTQERVTAWANEEGEKRPGRARLASRLLKAFLSWCGDHPIYKGIVTSNPAKNKTAREILGKPQANDAVLQREQLPAWFAAVRKLSNPTIAAYLQALLLTGARPNELTGLRWNDVDFQWDSMTIRDKVEGERVIPLTPYLGKLLNTLPRRQLTSSQTEAKGISAGGDIANEFVFSSTTSASGHLEDPHSAHYKSCEEAGVNITLYALRGSFASLCEWTECPAGIAAQIQGHKPSGVREKHYIRRPLDLLLATEQNR